MHITVCEELVIKRKVSSGFFLHPILLGDDGNNYFNKQLLDSRGEGVAGR